MSNYPLKIDVLPYLANRMNNYSIGKSRFDLANQVDNLRIKELCECSEPNCGSFYLTQYVENEDEFEGFVFEDIGSIEVHEGKIGFIEIFPSNLGIRKNYHNKLALTKQIDN